MLPKTYSREDEIEFLAALFERNGYVRLQNSDRLQNDSYRIYKKGDEIRLVIETRAEMDKTRRLLMANGLEPGKPFKKNNKQCLPIYGRRQTAQFLEMIGNISARTANTQKRSRPYDPKAKIAKALRTAGAKI